MGVTTASSSASSNQCSICVADLNGGDTAAFGRNIQTITLRCNHIFHHDCIKQRSQIERTCPLCSRKISKIELKPQSEQDSLLIEAFQQEESGGYGRLMYLIRRGIKPSQSLLNDLLVVSLRQEDHYGRLWARELIRHLGAVRTEDMLPKTELNTLLAKAVRRGGYDGNRMAELLITQGAVITEEALSKEELNSLLILALRQRWYEALRLAKILIDLGAEGTEDDMPPDPYANFQCDDEGCDKTFKWEHNLQEHKPIHSRTVYCRRESISSVDLVPQLDKLHLLAEPLLQGQGDGLK